ncbi:MAG: hypothetical protein EOO29_57865, partial [Comamonadaceae bacterium]
MPPPTLSGAPPTGATTARATCSGCKGPTAAAASSAGACPAPPPTACCCTAQYDPWARLVQTTVVAGDIALTTALEYLPGPPHAAAGNARAWVDQPIALIDAQGGRKTLGYNAIGQLASYTDCSGHTSRWQHDAWGDLTEETDALGQRTRHQRDAMGRLQQTTQADGTLVQYRWGSNEQVQAITLGALASTGPSSRSASVQ